MNDLIVVIDTEQLNVSRNDINVHSLFKISDLLAIFMKTNRIDETCFKTVTEYITSNQTSLEQTGKSHLDDACSIIGHILDDDIVIDSNGIISSTDSFCNIVAFSSPSAEVAEVEWLENPDSTSEIGAVEETNMVVETVSRFDSNSNDLLVHLLHQPSNVEPDSTSEEVIEQIKKPNTLPKKPFECPIVGCDTRFVHRKNISRHIKIKHGKLRDDSFIVERVKCGICEIECLNMDNFMDHHSSQHTQIERICEILTYSVPKPIYKSGV